MPVAQQPTGPARSVEPVVRTRRRTGWSAGLRGHGFAVGSIAWLVVLYGVTTSAVFLGGWLLGDATGWLYVANLSTFYWLAPAVVLALLALAVRWSIPLAACVVGAVVWIGSFGPLFLPQWVPSGRSLRVATFNLSAEPQVDHVERFVDRVRPDVLLVQEVVPTARESLVHRLPALPFHHFSAANPNAPGGGGTGVLTRFPITGARSVEGLFDVSRPMDVVTLDTDRGPVGVVSLHLTSPCDECLEPGPPRSPPFGRLAREARLRTREAEQVVAALPDGPLLVGGDLNSSTHNAPRRLLLDAGLVDLHRVAGSGQGSTSYRGRLGFRIDWLFASAQVTPVREWVDRPDFSDHRPVVADVQLGP